MRISINALPGTPHSNPVSNSTRTVAHSPWAVKWLIPFTTAIQRESGGALDAKTKELAIIRTSVVNTCDF
ncbi:MAG: carboxymuconolactone decarboxylase family protein [Nitrospinota bacterium]